MGLIHVNIMNRLSPHRNILICSVSVLSIKVLDCKWGEKRYGCMCVCACVAVSACVASDTLIDEATDANLSLSPCP